jgi:hypothetical protein
VQQDQDDQIFLQVNQLIKDQYQQFMLKNIKHHHHNNNKNQLLIKIMITIVQLQMNHQMKIIIGQKD